MIDPAHQPPTAVSSTAAPPTNPVQSDLTGQSSPVQDASSRLIERLRTSFSPTVKAVNQASPPPHSSSPPPVPSPSVSTPAAPSTPADTTGSTTITDRDKLNILEEVINEVDQSAPTSSLAPSKLNPTPAPGVIAQVTPAVTLEATQPADTLNPPTASTTSYKETEATTSPDTTLVEAGGSLQQVEREPQPEIPVEVEGYLQQVEEHADQLPEEIAIADGSVHLSSPHRQQATPVVVLPITAQEEDEGKKKSLTNSFRWLVEWSRKIIKMFTGKVVYLQPSEEQAT